MRLLKARSDLTELNHGFFNLNALNEYEAYNFLCILKTDIFLIFL